MKNTIAFTLCSNNYLAFAKTLADSFIEQHPDSKFIIGIADKRDDSIDYSFFEPHELIFVHDVPNLEVDRMADAYNIIEFNTSVKPFYFDYIFKSRKDVETVIYLDPDIKCFDSLQPLKEAIGEKSVGLTPHITTPLSNENFMIEKRMLNFGIYNLGFCWMNRSDNTQAFINWWMERLDENCKQDLKNGVFVDQLWVNLIPIYFKDDVHISYDLGLNMAYWNFHERKLNQVDDTHWMVNDKFKLKFFHFSSYKVERPDLVSKYTNYTFAERPDVVNLFKNYHADLTKNRYLELKDKPYKFNKGKEVDRGLIDRVRDFGYFVKLGLKAFNKG